ncbi:MAG: LysM peptidoglycan-binding domain-containing protein, partial [Burkholderiaceae bacterium]
MAAMLHSTPQHATRSRQPRAQSSAPESTSRYDGPMHRLARLLSALTASGLAAAATLAQPTKEPAGEAMWAYTVKRGDTLIGLSRELLQPGIGWKRVQRLNRVADPYRLMPGSTLRFPLAWLRLEQSTAEVVFVTGTVQVERAGTPPAALTVGARLRPSDTLVTGASPSAVALRLVDGSRVMLAPDSRMTIEQLALRGRSGALDTALRLEHGSADSRVVPLGSRPPRYRIDTPAMNLGVRGTEFRVHAPSASNTRLEVLEGSVAAGAAAGAAVQVDAGFGLLAQAGAQPQPARRLLDAPELPAAMPRVERLPMRLPWA